MISTSPPVSIPDVPITDYVLRHAARLGDKPALIDGPTGRTLSYRQLADGVRRTAAGLARRGFGKGQVFAIYCPNLPEYAVVFLGVAMAGGINTTVNPLYTVDELATQLNDSGARFLVTVPPFLDKAKEAAAKSRVEEVFVFGAAEGARPFTDLLQGGDVPPAVTIDPAEDLVALPYSSGTTGLRRDVAQPQMAEFLLHDIDRTDQQHDAQDRRQLTETGFADRACVLNRHGAQAASAGRDSTASISATVSSMPYSATKPPKRGPSCWPSST